MQIPKDGCLICQSELVYQSTTEVLKCSFCEQDFDSNVKCINSHYICDSCHSLDAQQIIEKTCNSSQTINPIELAFSLMSHPSVKMHGPEHHFLVPAVLITAYYNKIGKPQLKAEKLEIAKKRASKILGGFCGFYGNCGAGVGCGIFISTILEATPLSENEWKLANLISAESLRNIALKGGPRCCKRNTFTALETAIDFLKEHLDINLDSGKVICGYSERNRECKHEDCEYFPE